MNIRSIKDIDVANKKVLLRADLNVPISNNKITNSERIVRLLPTINYLIEKNAKIILISHFGRPKGQRKPELSLEIVAKYLNDFSDNFSVKFFEDAIGEQAEKAIESLKDKEVILLENLRFYKEEETNDIEFAKSLAKLADIYVNDAFSCSHRLHSSIDAISTLLPKAAGLLLQEEVESLEKFLNEPKKPLLAIIGGSKVSTKLSLLKNLVKKADFVFIGGAMANTFLKSQGYSIGKSSFEENLIEDAKEILNIAEANNCQIILPIDVVCSEEIKENTKCMLYDRDMVEEGQIILDIGPKTIAKLAEILKSTNTVVWNGPVGLFEISPFNIGTQSLTREIISRSREMELISVAGGGDIISALSQTGFINSFTYISTAGGAFLQWLEGKELPGLKNLQNSPVENVKDHLLL